jgi:predicted RNA-binding protein with EMAP domain
MTFIEEVDRLFCGAFFEISTIRTLVVNGSGAGVEFVPPRYSGAIISEGFFLRR